LGLALILHLFRESAVVPKILQIQTGIVIASKGHLMVKTPSFTLRTSCSNLAPVLAQVILNSYAPAVLITIMASHQCHGMKQLLRLFVTPMILLHINASSVILKPKKACRSPISKHLIVLA
jgi:hypothetical protein